MNEINKDLLTLLKEIRFKDRDTLNGLTPEESFDRFMVNVLKFTLGELWDVAIDIEDLGDAALDIVRCLLEDYGSAATIGSLRTELTAKMNGNWDDLCYILWTAYQEKLFRVQDLSTKIDDQVKSSPYLVGNPEYEWRMDKEGEPTLAKGLPVAQSI